MLYIDTDAENSGRFGGTCFEGFDEQPPICVTPHS
jgi:hypothetical protein